MCCLLYCIAALRPTPMQFLDLSRLQLVEPAVRELTLPQPAMEPEQGSARQAHLQAQKKAARLPAIP